MWYDRFQSKDKKFHFHLELTTKCNSACPICPRFIIGTPVRTSNIELWEVSIEDIKQWYSKELIQKIGSMNICGNFGDPIVCKDLYEIVEYFHTTNKKIKIDIRTNGGAKPVSFWEKLGKLSKKSKKNIRVVFSVDGLEDTNDLYRRNVKWEIVDRNIRTYTNNGGFGIQEFLIFNHNEHQIEDAVQQNKEWKLEYITFKQAYGFEDWENNKTKPFAVYDKDGNLEYTLKPSMKYNNSSMEYDPDTSHIKEYIEIFDDKVIHPPLPIKYENHDSIESNQINCQASIAHGGNLEVYVNSNGDVRPCCHTGVEADRNIHSDVSIQLREILSPKESFNLRTSSFSKIFKLFDEKFVKRWNSTHETGRCIKCSIQCGRVHQSNAERLYGADYEIKKKINYDVEIDENNDNFSPLPKNLI
jgi:MoaA/NifB/PqqE/SkfB family radical SAM enzyme